jgi:23S rRNA pseudouridine1911/1915/1917 synthase
VPATRRVEREETLRVDRGGAGKRLDRFLREKLPHLSRSFLQKLIEKGSVERNGTPSLKPSVKVEYNDRVRVVVPFPEKSETRPEDIPLSILYEDSDVAVVDKSAGMVVHPAPGHWSGTLVNALLHRLQDLSGIGGTERPGLVHRLDKDVSGLLLVAKHDRAHRALSAAFKARRVDKIYLALVRGRVRKNEGRIEESIARHPRNRKKMAVIEGGRPALTLYRVLERLAGATLLEVNLKTGRSHQARVHLAHIGHPILGDAVYGGDKGPGAPLDRIALHAWRLTLRHPGTGLLISFEAPVPEEMRALAEGLR